MNEVGKNLRHWRINKGLTQEQLAEQLNICRSVISDYENNKRELHASIIIKICKILEIDANVLLGTEMKHMRDISYLLGTFIANEKNSEEKLKILITCINKILNELTLK